MSGAKLVRKIVIQSKLKTQSPLRIGSGANEGLTDILILKDKQGQPFIPGTSMAGVLRSEIAAIYGEEAADKLFGLIDGRNANQSMLNISDVVLTSKGIIVRDGVAIDELTGVAKTGAKFDLKRWSAELQAMYCWSLPCVSVMRLSRWQSAISIVHTA